MLWVSWELVYTMSSSTVRLETVVLLAVYVSVVLVL